MSRKNYTGERPNLQKIGQKRRFNGEIISRSLEVVAKLTALGLGHGLLPTRVALQYAHLKKLKNAPIFQDEICLIYRPEKHNNVTSKKIIQIIKSSKF